MCLRHPSSRNGAVPRSEAVAIFFVVMGKAIGWTGVLMAVGIIEGPRS